MLPSSPPPPTKFHVWNLAEPAKSWPGAALGPLLQMRLFFFFPFFLLAHWAHSGWCCGVWFLKTLESRLCLFAHCLSLPRPAPVPPPSPLWQMNGGFNEHGRGVDWAVLKML